MSLVPLVSGGLDSTLMCLMAAEEDIEVFPLFVDYGQCVAKRELSACRAIFKSKDLPLPDVVDLSGYGKLLPSGLTSTDRDVFYDAFLPGRNMLFLLAGAGYAYQKGANAVAVGLLNEETSIFPDQTRDFLSRAEDLISHMLETDIKILAPLMKMSKADVVSLARAKGIEGTWSCHANGADPCGVCIACKEFDGLEM